MKKSHFIILLSLLLMGTTANAQFNKPLQSSSNRVNPNEAKYNIGLIGAMADRVLVMKNGETVECGDTAQVLEHPQEEYTRELLAAAQ